MQTGSLSKGATHVLPIENEFTRVPVSLMKLYMQLSYDTGHIPILHDISYNSNNGFDVEFNTVSL